ncbi:hypothetical protein VCR8J2_240083 [Vibrio coralliirubri]|nr:hypothetical protein VCR8J2_240083 [Vibrio coralliirubri]
MQLIWIITYHHAELYVNTVYEKSIDKLNFYKNIQFNQLVIILSLLCDESTRPHSSVSFRKLNQ